MKPLKNCTIGIASGKGGVGKTVITANLALSLAQQFRAQRGSVVAIDLDLGCGNLNTCLGVRSPNGTINSFLLKKVANLPQLLTPTEQANLQMICSSYSGSPEIRLDDKSKKDLLNKIRTLGADFVLMDLGAGTSTNVLDLFLAASEKIIVITPEALSLHNAFVFLKTVILHFLWRELEKEEFLSPLKSTLQRMVTGQEDLNVRKLVDRLKVWDRYSAYIVAGLIDDLKIRFVVNMYRGGAEESHLRNFHNLLFRHLCVRSNISYLGFVHFDSGVPVSVQGIRPFLLRYPDNRAAIDMWEVAERLAKEQELYNTPSLHFPKRPWWRSMIPY